MEMKKRWMKVIGLLIGLAMLCLVVWVGVFTVIGITRNQVNYFKDDSSYEEIICKVKQSDYGGKYFSDDGTYSDLYMWGDNELVVADNNFWQEVAVGESVIVMTAPRYMWDGFIHPIVALKVGDKVYLDFKTGKANQIKAIQAMRDKYLTISAPFIVVAYLCFCGAVFIGIWLEVKKKKQPQNDGN